MKVVMDDGVGLRVLLDAIRSTTGRVPVQLRPWAVQLEAVATRIELVTRELWVDGDASTALANAALYLEAFGHMVVAWIWLEQILAAEGSDGAFYDGKRAAARYFFTHELPRVGPQLDLLASKDRLLADLDDAIL